MSVTASVNMLGTMMGTVFVKLMSIRLRVSGLYFVLALDLIEVSPKKTFPSTSVSLSLLIMLGLEAKPYYLLYFNFCCALETHNEPFLFTRISLL